MPIVVKIDQEMRRVRVGTDEHTDTLTNANQFYTPMLYATAVGQIKIIQNTAVNISHNHNHTITMRYLYSAPYKIGQRR